MTELDTTGLKCPLPVLRARKALKSLDPGALLVVRATDPAAVRDFQVFCEETAHEFIDWTESDGEFRISLRKSD